MSRSNPNDHLANPSTRFFEWDAMKGNGRYYDKTTKKVVEVDLPFTFLLLEELAAVRGFHEASNSGIYSNEVRDTTTEVLVVKAFKGGTIAEGRYRDIKTTVDVAGGKYTASCYIAYKDGANYALGCIQFKGASLKSWMELRQDNRTAIWEKGVAMTGYVEGKKGRVTYRMPTFALVEVSTAADTAAKQLDAELQTFLAAYMKRNKREAADTAHYVPDDDANDAAPVMDSDIPF